MEQQDPVIKTEVKIEIDVAEEPPQSWYMTDKDPHVSGRTDFSTENTASLPMVQTSETQTVPCSHSGVWPKQEVGNLRMEQTSDPQTSYDCHNNIYPKQEVTEDQCNMTRVFKTDAVREKARTENCAFDCEGEPDTQGTVHTVHMKQDNTTCGACMLVCSANTVGIKRRDVISGDGIGSINTPVTSCQQGVRPVGESLNYITVKRTLNFQALVAVHPTGNSAQLTSAVCSKRGSSVDFDSIQSGFTTGKRFPDESCLRDLDKDARNNNAEKVKPHACQQCSAKFSRLSYLKHHMLMHTGQKPHVCQQCDAKFSHSGHLKDHVLIHMGQKLHACQQCSAKFTCPRYLKRHLLTYSEQKHACQQCSTKFTCSSYLKRHMLMHSGQKHYTCQQCDTKFTQSGTLRHHMLMHTGQKPHDCPEYDAKFRRLNFFFTLELVSTLCQYTNMYAQQHGSDKPSLCGSWVDMRPDDMYQYIALIMYMAVVQVPNIEAYWSTATLYQYHGLWARAFMSKHSNPSSHL